MTQKELSYLEDAIKHEQHEQNLAQICDNVVNNLTDEELIAFIKTQQKTHKNIEKKLLKVMEDIING